MNNDYLFALGIFVVFLTVVYRQEFTFTTLETLLKLGRPGATILLLGAVLYVYAIGKIFSSLALGLLVVYLLKDLWTNYIRSDARRLHLEIGRDQARFDPSTSIDLQFANGDAVHDAPSYLGKDKDNAPLLIFPPSAATLHQMNG
jgi:hypothetical protein